jgi:hypothetical protein
VGWFRFVCSAAACTIVYVYVSIRLSKTVSKFRSIVRFRTQNTGHRTTGYKPGHFADLTYSAQIAASSTPSSWSKHRLTQHVYERQDGRIDIDLDSEVRWYRLQALEFAS